MSSVKYEAIRDADVKSWPTGSAKLSMQEVAKMFGVELDGDGRNAFFWKLQLDKRVVVTEEILDWLGCFPNYAYDIKKKPVIGWLIKNPQVSYTRIADRKDPQKFYHVLEAMDFESMTMQIDTPRAAELRKLFSLAKMLVVKYREYERHHDAESANLLRQMQGSACDSLVIEHERRQAREELRLAERERRRAEAERLEAEEFKRRTREELYEAEEQNRAVHRELARVQKHRARVERRTRYRLGLYAVKGDFYLMRRRTHDYGAAEKRLLDRGMTAIQTWEDVPHDVGAALRSRCRNMAWEARYNSVRVPEDIGQNGLMEAIEEILYA